ncbi:MAG: hypothetical protein ACP5RP_01400 [Candidatus Micrarchaeia archaeon]
MIMPIAILALVSIPSISSTWIEIGYIACLAVIGIAGMIYAFAGVLNSPDMKNWAKIQVYEAVVSFALLFVFNGLNTLFLMNPVSAMSSVNLVPSACNNANVDTLFGLSMCDLGYFQSIGYSYFSWLYASSIIIPMFAPVTTIGISVPFMPNVSASFSINPVPLGVETFISGMFSSLIVMLMLNQIQLILVSASVIFLGVFMVIGLIARTFGFSRRFGGVMIALGLGFGFIYPLMIATTYGFIDRSLVSPSTFTESIVVNLIMLPFTGGTAAGAESFDWMLSGLAPLAAGLTFIPFLNFVILDAFILDFSTAIGERINFLDMLGNLI